MDHPIHLHSWPFVVTRRSDDMPLEPGWKDTVNVPAGAEVRIRIPFVDFTGRSVYHCHILDHEDLGMMATVEVR
jgi:FtsP/CotA-like multicopper oxidase with cupredoxin domain